MNKTDKQLTEELFAAMDQLNATITALRAENARLREEHEASVTGYEIACDILTKEGDALRVENARLQKRVEQAEGYIYDKCLWEDFAIGIDASLWDGGNGASG